jgi:mRNA-degrading endonuclease RelE of RelBE toxin-antitoxin system
LSEVLFLGRQQALSSYIDRVEEGFPGMSSLSDKLDIRKIQGYENYYRIRIGQCRIGCEIETGNKNSAS